MDRYSHIPDSVLCHILSFLPTKTAVITGILSRRWRHLWKHLQVFNFSESDFSDEDETRFIFFVYSVLAMRKTREIRKFHLSSRCWSPLDDHIPTWIRTATGPHLQELEIVIPTQEMDEILSLPLSVFTCSGLVSLSLIGPICVEQLQTVYLPCLKTLILDIYFSLCPMDTLLSGCPDLETLHLTLTEEVNKPKIRVPPWLKSLTYADETTFVFPGCEIEIEGLEIDTPYLEYLSISMASTCSHFSVIYLQNVLEAHIEIYCSSIVLTLLEAITRTQVLILHRSTIQGLLDAPILDFPEFGFLLRLELALPCFNSEFLLNLLHKCDMLQVLTIRWEILHQPLGSWTQPINDPNCLRSHLIIFEYLGYQGYAMEQAFIAYVLQRGLLLKTVTIHADRLLDLKTKYHILKELSIIPRASNRCQLNFD